MNVIQQIRQSFFSCISSHYGLSQKDLDSISFDINTDEAKQQFGDLSSNAALVLTKQLQKNPRAIAQKISEIFSDISIEKIEIAGPGFLNFFLTQKAFQALLHDLYTSNKAFFAKNTTEEQQYVCVEFVSANPTGPLHLGHGRGGIIGDVLGNIFNFVGHQATKEFYINDAGVQMQKLGKSLKIRCQQASDMDIELPENSYAGEYLVDLAQQCIKEYGVAVIGEPETFFTEYGKAHLLENIKETLKDYGIHFDVWFSEKTLHTDGSINTTLKLLKQNGHLFEKDGAVWFSSTSFDDDKDRVLRKSSGELTYVAADAAYMKNKADRGFKKLIMILGHDHHGYVHRLQGLRKALKLESITLDAILYQLVKMKSNGQQVRMSKRAGNIVTLRDVIDTVGTDIARFFYLNRKADAQLEFDLDLALKKTDENPVYYVQYAYVRTKSILQKAQSIEGLQVFSVENIQTCNEHEKLLIKKITSLQHLLQAITHNYQTHLLTYYALELAQLFHRYYAHNRIIDAEDPEQSLFRLLIITTLKNSFETIFELLGISKPEKM